MSALAIRQMTEYERMGLTETVVYHPYDGKARSIDALVNRDQMMDALNTQMVEVHVTVMNDQIYGIVPHLMDRGADQLEVAERHGGDLETREIQRIISQDEEWVTLAVA